MRRFREEVELIRALWTQPKVDYHGRFYQLDGGTMSPKPVQKPLPIWMGVGHPERGAARGDDGGRLDGVRRVEHRRVRRSVPLLREALEKARARSGDVPDLEAHLHGGGRETRRWRARELHRWFTEVYHNPPAPTRRASTARRNRCASGSRRSSRWAPTTCCSTRCRNRRAGGGTGGGRGAEVTRSVIGDAPQAARGPRASSPARAAISTICASTAWRMRWCCARRTPMPGSAASTPRRPARCPACSRC